MCIHNKWLHGRMWVHFHGADVNMPTLCGTPHNAENLRVQKENVWRFLRRTKPMSDATSLPQTTEALLLYVRHLAHTSCARVSNNDIFFLNSNIFHALFGSPTQSSAYLRLYRENVFYCIEAVTKIFWHNWNYTLS